MNANKLQRKKKCVLYCESELFDLVHKFPTDINRAKQWINILNVPKLDSFTLEQIRKRFFVCCRHFRKEDYKNLESRGLNKTAIPSLNLRTVVNFNSEDNETSDFILGDNEIFETNDALEDDIEIDNLKAKDCVMELANEHNLFTDNFSIEGNSSISVEDYDSREINQISRKRNICGEPIKFKREIQNLSFSEKPEISNNIIYIHTLDEICIPKENITELINTSVNNEIENPNKMVIQDEGFQFVDLPEVLNESTLIPDLENNIPTSGNTIEIHHSNYANPIKLHYFWLRDNCCCKECYNSDTSEKLLSILDIPLRIEPRTWKIIEDDLFVEWNDDHISSYNFEYLYNSTYEINKNILSQQSPVLWNKDEIENLEYARVNLHNYLCEDVVAKNVVQSLIKYGIAFIEKVPANIQSTEMAIKRLFSLQKTFFGEMFVSDSVCNKRITAHTDNTYYTEASALKIFHCIHHNGSGGKILLVDGFNSINDLKTKDISTFNRLCETPVSFQFTEREQNYENCTTLIKNNIITNKTEQIRYNQMMRTCLKNIPHDKIEEFYTDYRLLAKEIQSPNKEWWFQLNPGTILICDNYRILHGWDEIEGKHTLARCYVSRSDFLSAARIMNVL